MQTQIYKLLYKLQCTVIYIELIVNVKQQQQLAVNYHNISVGNNCAMAN